MNIGVRLLVCLAAWLPGCLVVSPSTQNPKVQHVLQSSLKGSKFQHIQSLSDSKVIIQYFNRQQIQMFKVSNTDDLKQQSLNVEGSESDCKQTVMGWQFYACVQLFLLGSFYLRCFSFVILPGCRLRRRPLLDSIFENCMLDRLSLSFIFIVCFLLFCGSHWCLINDSHWRSLISVHFHWFLLIAIHFNQFPFILIDFHLFAWIFVDFN